MRRILLLPFWPVTFVLTGLVRSLLARPWTWTLSVLTVAIVVGLGFTFEGLPVVSMQRGYRGTGMYQAYNPRTIRPEIAANRIDAAYPPVQPAGRTAAAAYQNIKVLKDVDANEMLRLMAAMQNWIAPSIGCSYCHSTVNMADDKVYQKDIARHMLEMTRYINTNWKSHVGEAGVTCGTCHRGAGAPKEIWHFPVAPVGRLNGMAEIGTGKNAPSAAAGYTSLPSDPFTPFLLNAAPIRVTGTTALPSGNRQSIKQTDWTYALMVHFAQSLGVSCTFCHNSRAFEEWDQGSPQRVTAWHGIEMVRDLNRTFMVPITKDFPAGRLGPAGDVAKINCGTCHQGAYQPFYGASTLDAYPELKGPAQPREARATPHIVQTELAAGTVP